MSIVERRGAEADVLDMLTGLGLPHFTQGYTSLGTLLSRRRTSIGTNPVNYSTPPGQTTVPLNPKFSGGSSSSAESKAEPYAQNVATKFLEMTFLTIARWVQRLPWATPDAQAFIYRQYNPLSPY